MRKLSYLLILGILLIMLSGCAPDTGDDPADTTGSTTETTEQTEATTETEITWELTLGQETVTFTKKAETCQLYTGTVPAEDVTWGSDDPQIATFENGVVTAVAKGETVVWAEYEGIRVNCAVRCDIRETVQSAPDDNTGLSREPVLAPPTEQVVDSSFFDDAVFIGDSITLRLSYYAASSGELGKAKFLVAGSYSVGAAIYDKMEMSYRGKTYQNIEEAVAATEAKKVFILLGMNDIARSDFGYIDGTITNWGTLVDLVRAACPDVTIYIQSLTPVWTGGEKGGLRNPRVNEYNEKLEAFAAEKGCQFIDVASYMKDETGGMATIYSVDQYVHLNYEGAAAWTQVLKAYTDYQ